MDGSTIVNALREIKGEKCIMRVYWRPDETKHTSELRRRRRQMRLWRNFQDAIDEAGDSLRNLFEMPSVLHRQAKAGRYCRPSRKIPAEVQKEFLKSRQT